MGEDLPAGCAGGGRLFQQDRLDCAAGQIMCWNRCQPTTGLPCRDSAKCYNTAVDPPVLVPPTTMCGKTCKPECPAVPAPTPPNVTAPPPPPAWCHSLVDVDMGMNGFEWSHADCIMFLFKQLSLVSALIA